MIQPERGRLGLSALLSALREIDEPDSSACSSPQSYHSYGHDGLTDIDSDTELLKPDANAANAANATNATNAAQVPTAPPATPGPPAVAKLV